MSRHFFDDAARGRTAAAIKALESKTSAEVVVSVRARSGDYRHTDAWIGVACALTGLVALLFLPDDFGEGMTLLATVALYASGAMLCAGVPGLRRRLTSRRYQQEQVLRSARAAFVELGVSRTDHRIGILVFVSLLERTVALVPDVGVPVEVMGPAWEQARAALETALRATTFEVFAQQLEALATPLATVLPHTDGQLNQLPDEPQAAS